MNTEKVTRILLLGVGAVLAVVLTSCAPSLLLPQYYFPLQGAKYVSTGTTIAVRYGPELSAKDVAGLSFTVRGSVSGPHQGKTILADDHKTVIFKPDAPFSPGEVVTVDVNSLLLSSHQIYRSLSYLFYVAQNQEPGSVLAGNPPVPASEPKSAFPNFLTVPQDIPHFTVTKASTDNSEGDVFVAPFYWTKSKVGSYLLILNGQGQLVYYESMADQLYAFDFKEQPNGMLSYFDQRTLSYVLMNSHYQVVDNYQAGNGYAADLHDFQLLPNGNALLMAADAETVDMSNIVPGGKPDAVVTGLIIQELDPSKNVIFQWRSWDHMSFYDSTVGLTDDKIDLIHGNALALANDGNLLLSSRNLSEITKINLQTGDIMWRLGGKANMFQFVNGVPFAYQHDVRQLPNGDITLFDNHGTTDKPAASHALEYRLDVVNKTATQVWEYTHVPPVFGTYMGNVERLADGNTFVSWGAPSTAAGFAYVSMTEVDPNNQVVFELSFDQPYVSYRAFRAPWQGTPDTPPALAYEVTSTGITLGYSWNGATDVAGYQVFGGSSPDSLQKIDEQTKSDFETQSRLTGVPQNECYFQVAAMDANGREMARSQVISTSQVNCPLPSGS